MSIVPRMSHPDVRMVQALCGNLKMAFDSAKVNFLEARKALQVFHRLLKKLETLERTRQDGEDVVLLKRMMTNIKESVSFLQTKLTKNSDTAKEGFQLLQERLTKINGVLESLSTKKRKYEDGYESYKRLRTGLHSKTIVLKDEKLSLRKLKLDSLEKAIESTNESISNVNMEKEALSETCSKMEDFLDSTKGFIMQLRNKRFVVSKQGVTLNKWCTDVLLKSIPLLDIRKHIVDASTMIFEFSNPPDYPMSAPRLILTARFMKYQRGPHPYALMHAEVNHDSVNIVEALENAILRNDVLLLLSRVQATWQKRFLLLNEIVLLRERFPIDWKVYEGKLCVLLGDRVNVSCTFNVPMDYPDKGSISIDRVDGLPAETNIDDLKPHGVESPRLTAWVEYLAERFYKV